MSKESVKRSTASLLLEKNVKSLLIRSPYRSLAQLAEEIGISAPTLTHALKGNPQLDTIEKIARALDVSVSDLFKERSRNQITGYLTINEQVFPIYSKKDILAALNISN